MLTQLDQSTSPKVTLQTSNPNALEQLKTIDTIEDLRQLDITGLTSDTAIYVKGYYTPGDHGGGVFIWMPQLVMAIDQDGDGQDEAADDFGGTILAPASVTFSNQAGRWMRVFDGGTLHTMWFGIKSNRNQGTDLSARLNLAIKRAATLAYNDTSGGNNSYNPGMTLEIDPGRYEIQNTIHLPLPGVQGNGANGSGATDLVIAGHGERTQIFWTGNNPAKSIVRLSNYKGSELRDLQIINTNTAKCMIELVNDLGGPTPTGLRLTRLLLTSYQHQGEFNGRAVNFGVYFNSTGQEGDRNNDLVTLQDVRVTHTNFAYVLTGFNCHDIIFQRCSMAENNIGLYANPAFFKWYNGYATSNKYTDFYIPEAFNHAAIIGHNSEHSGRFLQTGICQGNVTAEKVRFESNEAIAGCAVAVADGTILTLRQCRFVAGDSLRIHYYASGGYPYERLATAGKNALVEQCLIGSRRPFAYTADFIHDACGFVQFAIPAQDIDFTAFHITLQNNHGFVSGQAVTIMSDNKMNLPRVVYLSLNPSNSNQAYFCRTYSDAVNQTGYLPLTNNIYNQPVRFSTLACPIYISESDWSITVGAANSIEHPTNTGPLQSVMPMLPTFIGVKAFNMPKYSNKIFTSAPSRLIHKENNIKLNANYQAIVARLKHVRGPIVITLSLCNQSSDSISFVYCSASWMNTTDYYALPVFFSSSQTISQSIQLIAKLSRTNNFHNVQFHETDLIIKCDNLSAEFHQSFSLGFNSIGGLENIGLDVERFDPIPVSINNPVSLSHTPLNPLTLS